MAVLNITPDSFSGDGVFGSPGDAVDRGRQLTEEGADMIDIGGESTRPGHTPVPASEELDRILPTIASLTGSLGMPISVDTRKSEVAALALDAGATVINDVSFLADPLMAPTVGAHGAGLIIVHRGNPPRDVDLLGAVNRELEERVEVAVQAGVDQRLIAVDPGLGIGKDWRANLEIMRRLGEVRSLGLPVVVGPSRKGTIGRVLGVESRDRLEGTAALVVLAIAAGVDVVRVHDVRAMVRVARMTDALAR